MRSFIWVHPNPIWLMSYKKRKLWHRYQGKVLWRHRKKIDICKSRKEALGKTNKQTILLTPWSGPSSIHNSEKINFCCLSHPVCGTMLWQPQQTNTSSFPKYVKFWHGGVLGVLSLHALCIWVLLTPLVPLGISPFQKCLHWLEHGWYPLFWLAFSVPLPFLSYVLHNYLRI